LIPTIKDIAQQVGMSVPTVSQILNNKGQMYRAETRKRVRAAADELGYRPNRLGQALRGGKSMTIGIVAAGLNVPSTMLKINGLINAARQTDYLPFAVPYVPDEPATILRVVQDLVDHRVDGIVVYISTTPDTQLVRQIIAQPVPVLFMGAVTDPPHHCVAIDRWPGIRDTVRHLFDLGHRRIAAFRSEGDENAPGVRLQHWRRAFDECGLDFESMPHPHYDPHSIKTSSYERTLELVKQPNRPTAILGHNDEIALAAMAAIIDSGLSVPEDISVTGYDDLPHMRFLRPALTTVHQPREEIGEAAFAQLHKLIQKPDMGIEPILFPTRMVVGQSTAPASLRSDNQKETA